MSGTRARSRVLGPGIRHAPMGVSGFCGGTLASAPSAARAAPGRSLTRGGRKEGKWSGWARRGGWVGGHVVEGV